MGRILIVKRGDLGDLLLTIPAVRSLRLARPDARLELLAPPLAREVYRGLGLIDAHLDLPSSGGGHRAGWRTLRALAELRRGQYDAAVLLEHLTTVLGTSRYAAILLASGARRRVGLDNGRGWFLTERAPDAGFGAMHEAEYWLRIVALAGADPAPSRIGIARDAEATSLAEDLLRGLTRTVVAIHPGGGQYSVARRWPADRFVAVGRALKADGHDLIVIGNEAELDRTVASATGARDLTGQTPLRVLRDVLERCALLISSDSGVVHVASATDVPIVAIYGLTDPRAWGPFRPGGEARTAIIERPLACRPCLYRGHRVGFRHGCATRDCLVGIAPGRVLAEARRLLGSPCGGATVSG